MAREECLRGGNRGGVGALLGYLKVLAKRLTLLAKRGAVGKEIVVPDVVLDVQGGMRQQGRGENAVAGRWRDRVGIAEHDAYRRARK